MKKNCRVSIIVPIYNGERFIKRGVNSILNQSHSNIEIILINDGSTDNSLKILQEFANVDDRIILINKENTGVSDSRNLGISKATGEYISFIDIDDWIDSKYIERMIFYISNNNVDAVRCNFYRVYSEDDITENEMILNTGIYDNYSKNILIDYILTNKIQAYTWLFFIKSDIAKKNTKFNEKLTFLEDTVWILELLLRINSIYVINERLYYYYLNKNSATQSNNRLERNLKDSILTYKIEKNILLKFNQLTNERKEYIAKTVLIFIDNIFFRLFINKKSSEKLKDKYKILLNSEDLKKILKEINIFQINLQLHIKISIFLLRYGKVNCLIYYYYIRKLMHNIKTLITKRKE